MAKVTGITDIPDLPGAGLLHFDDGRPPLMAMPEVAADYRAKFGGAMQGTADASGRIGSGQAEDAASFKNTLKSVGNFFTTPIGKDGERARAQAQAAQPTDPVSGQPLPPGVRVGAPGEFPTQAAPPPAAPAPAPQQAPGPEQGPPPGIAAEPPPESEPESPEVQMARAIIARKEAARGSGGPARMAPVSEKTEVTRGAPYDLGMARERLSADDAVKEAAYSKMRAEKADYDAQAAQAAAAIPKLQLEQARAQNEVDQREKDYRIERAGLEKELDDYDKSAQVDPRRFFSGDHAISGMLAIVGAGLGAAGASLAHTQNWAFESMQKQIQQDIDAQVQDINTGHATRATALKRFVDYYNGDMNKAQTALAIAMNKAVTTEAARFAAQSKSKEIANNAASFGALFDQNTLKREQDLYTASLGTTKSEQTSKMQGGPGSGGPKTSLDDVLKLIKIEAAAKGKGGKDQGALGLSATAEARAASTYNTKKEQIERNYSAMDEMAHLMGLKIDRKTGTVIDPETGRPATEPKKSPGVGVLAGKLPNSLVGVEGRELRRSRQNAARLHAKTIYDKAITAEEAEHEMPAIMGTQESDLVPSLQQQLKELSDYDYKLDAGAAAIDPRIVNERYRALGNVNYSRATGTPLAPPRPRPGGVKGDTGSDEVEANTGE